ncbi:aldo/keto reductase [Mangrovihabitans endophyticus]|uniref:Aldo/keto reductase n=1 Tax=Mangrovihabitans endophyticus TaxID=1751298 RepID=A0A8J3FM63_9ACTN|nr:aldo/keto reductase [Mangrovihabitans endophyticus]GGK73528.1 aldo/keto reductase [Mangrovihabitans endophyticus]
MPLDSYVTLGRSGLRVSPFALGAMTFGEHEGGIGTSSEESISILETYLDRGGNFIDTANFYTNGHSEAILGDFFASKPGQRDRVVLATKFFTNLHLGDPNAGGAGRKAILGQVDGSLRRLKTDYLDVYYLHNYDRNTPIEETMTVLDGLVGAGKIRYVAFSNIPAWVTAQAQTMALLRAWEPIIALQVEYSLLARTVEGELAPLALDAGMGIVPWGPLKNGFLSGKYTRDGITDESKRAGMAGQPSEQQFTVIDEVGRIARELGSTHAAVSLAWLRRQPGVVSPIIGARRLAHLESNLAALDVELSADQLARLDAASTPRLNYPYDLNEMVGAMLQFGGTTIDGVVGAVYPPLAADRIV